jgi:hypothetical protein
VVLLLQTVQAAPSGWDNLRDWISAVGSLAAAVVAAVAFLWGLRGRRERAWAELTSQARRIVAFPDTAPTSTAFGGVRSRGGGGAETAAVTVRNTSDEPVYDCRIGIRLRNEARPSGGEDALSLLLPIVPPGSTTLNVSGAPVDNWRMAKIHIFFVDSANVWWFRDENGRLDRADLAENLRPGRFRQWLHRRTLTDEPPPTYR